MTRSFYQISLPADAETSEAFVAVRAAVELAQEGTISKHQALMSVTPEQMIQLIMPSYKTTGEISMYEIATCRARLAPHAYTLLSWADEVRELGVRANANTREDAVWARKMGADGIGLCSTEQMFLSKAALPVVVGMILSVNPAERRTFLAKLLSAQRRVFIDIFRAMNGYPVTIRLLESPLREFIDRAPDVISTVKVKVGLGNLVMTKRAKLRMIEEMNEHSPFMVLQSFTKVGVLFPELYEMQVRAIFGAALEVAKEGLHVNPEVLVPLRGQSEVCERLQRIAGQMMAREQIDIPCKFGTAAESPRAARTVDRIVGTTEFSKFANYASGSTYVSCSPYLVPMARLAAAQARIASNR